MKTIIVLSNNDTWTYNLRAEVLKALIDAGHKIIVVVGGGKKIDDLKSLGCEHVDVPFSRHGKNIFAELKLLFTYWKIIRKVKPDIVLSYTIKPNLYGSLVCRLMRIPCVPNITGLGTAVEYPGILQKILLKIYKIAFKNIHKVFFQNTANRDLFLKHGIVKSNFKVLPGSGVNLEKYEPLDYPVDDTIEFVFISRIMKEKGIEEYLYAAKYICQKYENVKFHICGFCEQAYEPIIEDYQKSGYIFYHGMIDDVRTILKQTHCTILPTYYPEGMSNVLLESAACARPIITTDRPGCGEIVEQDYNGYIVKAKDKVDLINVIEKFLSLSSKDKIFMGINGRFKVEKEFDRQLIVEDYLKVVNEI